MHAKFEDLLAIKDGNVNAMFGHVQQCSHCQSELNALNNIGSQLFQHYDSAPSDDVWQRIQTSVNESKEPDAPSNVLPMKPHSMQSLTRAVYALAASIAFVGLVSIFMLSGRSQHQQTQLLQASVDQLMTNSRGLEQSLQQVVQQNQALSVSNQQAADRLYWRLTYVDQLIQGASPENSDQLKVLWNDRVEALNELNKLYFEHNNVVALSEI